MLPISSSETLTSCQTVLLIDDNEDDRKDWSDGLRNVSTHYAVLEASSAEEGLQICRNNKVDCVVLDLDMPLSGFHALLELIPDRRCPEIAVIILTYLVHPYLSKMAEDSGAQAWLIKKRSTPEDLHHAIQKAVTSVKSIENNS